MESQRHNEFMAIALKEAFSSLGATSPNPAVGAVIVNNDTIVATGATQAYGMDHAEVVALKKAAGNAAGASMYITLEPCCHFGKTPPCTDAIIGAGIAKVFIPTLDPNPAVSGKGVRALKQAGVEVIFLPEFTQAAVDLLRPFKKSIMRHRPFIIHKTATSLDGRTATELGDAKWISSPVSRLLVHRLRACADTIIVGKATVEKDNPLLNVRFSDFTKDAASFYEAKQYSVSGYCNSFIQGLLESWKADVTHELRKIVIGLPETLQNIHLFHDPTAYFFISQRQRETLLKRNDYELIKKCIDNGRIRFLQSYSGTEQIHELLDILYSMGSMIAILEGGATVAGSFFDANEIDQCMYFYSPILVGKGKNIIEGKGRQYIKDSLKLHDITHVFLGHDMLLSGYKEIYQFEAL
ncbi:MAG: bifunctional diaminohydroxyphosphoribosylaminopyrimidine deaminase/5-amino-6-(5-phosphoribosylamino)uracil reductase RibD [Spirochaetes bacterium]|nr:bifunctional diaminohydroxyphosphoribosylaminopyrimidine deaminase/5-amino-6-(5-phosphoribosylamino)uracil reductase RibD [Spirochaetota bacterium]